MFLVLHIPAHSPSLLPEILSRSGLLPASHPTHGEAIEQGRIYVAPPDHHLLVEEGAVLVVRGPKENRHRPAIDPLFRSAARAYGPRVVGVVLTGSLDDGTAGLLAIKRQGGVTVVQDPEEALYASMPRSALAHVAVDHVLPLAQMGPLLARLAQEPSTAEGRYPVPEEMERETKVAAMDMNVMQNGEHVGTPSVYSCPECHGVLWEVRDGTLLRFRCRVGHAYSLDSMLAGQAEVVEQAMWAALKTLEESASLSRRMAKEARAARRDWVARRFEEKAQEAQQHAALLQQVLVKGEVESALDGSAHLVATQEQGAIIPSRDAPHNEG
jgi:two-component system, chemotaxis family, protein-glutamate methylesterase/glutaminase